MIHVSVTLLALLLIFSTIGNILVILSAIFNKRLRNYTHALIINLAVADLLISLFSLPLRILRLSVSKKMILESNISAHAFCKFTTCVTIILFAASNFFLLLLTFDRYFAIKHAFFYKVNFEKKHMIALIISAWLLAASVGIIPMFVRGVQTHESNSADDSGCTYASVIRPAYTIFTVTFTYFAPSFAMFLLYASIIRKVHSSMKSNGGSSSQRGRVRSSLSKEASRRKERRMSMGILFLLAAHTTCMAPICILDLVQIIGKNSAPAVAVEICLFLSYANQFVNAPTYAAANREYYSTFKSLLCCFGKARSICKACLAIKSRRTSFAVNAAFSSSSDNAWYIVRTAGI